MSKIFDISRFKNGTVGNIQYQRQLKRIAAAGNSVDSIENAVRDTLKNLSTGGQKTFVIYGEPQSGKTEMMICLTARLLDEGRQFILHLMNDSVDLLGQNLGRFQASGLAPSAQNFSEILDPSINVRTGRYVIFCKKNGSDLRKLITKIGQYPDITIIDDEADYASPNSKVNQNEKTKINELITKLLGKTGDYIGVTATPARIDLNNTFNNDSGLWVKFSPHPFYTGQDVFFPFEDVDSKDNRIKFRLTLLPDKGDDPKYARQAFLRFLVNAAYLNIYNNNKEENYSILIHTSGKKIDHKNDWTAIQDVLAGFTDSNGKKFDLFVKEVWQIAHDRYTDADPDEITGYIVKNISRNSVITLNSDRDFTQKGASATRPASLFTIVIGGNIVSRGVTFENLLSMYFTRDVKHKIQQDTYIQRARMFGSRGKYLEHFELTIPEQLYGDWHRCFVFHRLSLASITSGKGSPVWLADKRISTVSTASIDKSTVDIDRGEMSFAIFDFDASLDDLVEGSLKNSQKLDELGKRLGENALPSYIITFIKRTSPDIETSIAIQKSASAYGSPEERQAIIRKKGFMGPSQMNRSSGAIHFLKIFTNEAGRGRMFYKFDGSIQFIKNLK